MRAIQKHLCMPAPMMLCIVSERVYTCVTTSTSRQQREQQQQLQRREQQQRTIARCTYHASSLRESIHLRYNINKQAAAGAAAANNRTLHISRIVSERECTPALQHQQAGSSGSSSSSCSGGGSSSEKLHISRIVSVRECTPGW
jgi:hypothetical protein